jgi:hypothetical protein
MYPFGQILAVGGIDTTMVAVWFVASVAIVFVVTLMYKYVLRVPPPAGPTAEKVEQLKYAPVNDFDTNQSIERAVQAIAGQDYATAANLAVHASTEVLRELLISIGGDPSDMNISDLSYLLETRAKTGPKIAPSCYQLNSLRLKALQGQPLSKEEAEWTVSTAQWLKGIVDSKAITF